MKTTLLFDLDNTLIDRNYAIEKTFELLIQSDGIIDSDKSILRNLMLWDDYGYAGKEFCFTSYSKTYPTKLKSWNAFQRFNIEHQYLNTRVFPKTVETLIKLKETFRIGIITNGSSEGQRRKLAAVNFDLDFFEIIVISDDLNIHKPNPEIFQSTLRKLSIKPEETIYIGDNITNDIIGSLDVGMSAIWMNPYKIKGNPNVLEINKLEELLKIDLVNYK